MADNNNSEDLILNIQVRNSEALQAINEYNQANYQLKKTNQDLNKQNKDLEKSNKSLNKEVADGTRTRQEADRMIVQNNASIRQNIESITENTQQINANNAASRLYQRELQNNIKMQQEKENSMIRLEAEIANNVLALRKLGDTEDDLAKKATLKEKINELQDRLNDENESIQRYYHNVGNYQEAIINAAAGNNKFAQSLLASASAGKGMGGVVDMVKGKVQALFAAIIANPVMAVIAAIVVVFMALKKVIDSSEESTAKFNKVLAPLNMLLDGLLWVLQKVVGFFLDGVIAVQKFAIGFAKLAEKLPLVGSLLKEVNKHIEKSIELEQRKADLEKRTRAVQEQNAKHSRDVAKLRADAEDKLNHTAEERLKFIREANNLEKESADNALAIAKEKLSIAEAEADRTENTTEKEKELSNLRAEVYKAEETHFNKIRELQGKEIALLGEITKAEKDRQDKSAAQAKEYRDKELAATIALQNLKFNQEANAQRKILDSEQKSYSERLDALVKYNATQIAIVEYNKVQELKREKLTRTEKELIIAQANDRLLELRYELNAETLRLQKEQQSHESEVFFRDLDNKLASIRKGTAEELSLRLAGLQKEQALEIENAEKTGENVAVIRNKYRALETQAHEEHEAYLASQKQKEFQNRILEAELEGQNTLGIKIEQKNAELEALNQLESESDLDYYNRKLQLQNELKEIEDQYLNYQLETRIQVMQATATIAGGFQELFESMAEDNAAFASFAKAMALYQIGIDTATALTAGVKQAQSVPFPGNIAAIATTVATILSNIAKAKKFLTSEKEPKAPKFNQGGLVTGGGSGTSDSIPAYLSNGESVMTERATSMFSPILSAFNQIGGGVPISTQDSSNQVMGEEMLSRAFAKAVLNIPNPVVSVQEIDYVGDRIEVLEASRSL